MGKAPPPRNKPDPRRRRDLAMIHMARVRLGLDEDLYRTLLRDMFGVESSADLDAARRERLIAWFRSHGWADGRRRADRPRWFKTIDDPMKGRMSRKIWALLADAGRGDAYIDALVKRMFGIDRLEFCSPDQLYKVISALEIDAGRRSGRAER